jgi:Fanconi anemia group M protein
MIQKILKPENRVLIIADYRENNNLVIDSLNSVGALVRTLPLKVGDFICSDRVCIERKSGNDFVSSLIDGRLFKQAIEMKENFSKPIFLVEGSYYRPEMNDNAIKSSLASIIIDFDIPIVFTRDEIDTAKTIFWIAKREQFIHKRIVGIKGKKKPKQIEELQESFISGLPGISTVLSKRILNKFKTIKNFVNARESELTEVNGIGKTLVKRLHILLNKEYGGSA